MTENKEEAVTQKEELLYMAVRERAEHGLANRRMLELLRARFGGHAKIRIVSGHHSPHKIISVE